MKNIYKTLSIFAAAILICIYPSCKKDSTAPTTTNTPNNNNTTCNYTTNVLVINSIVNNIVSDSCRVFGSNYYTEHWVDAGKTEGIAIIFNGTSLPAAGTYTAVNTFAAVDATHVYVEYYTAADAYQPASGTVTVTDNGSSKIYTFCNFSCTNGSATKTVSLRATCN
jgi:hypothetical protein